MKLQEFLKKSTLLQVKKPYRLYMGRKNGYFNFDPGDIVFGIGLQYIKDKEPSFYNDVDGRRKLKYLDVELATLFSIPAKNFISKENNFNWHRKKDLFRRMEYIELHYFQLIYTSLNKIAIYDNITNEILDQYIELENKNGTVAVKAVT